MAAEPSIFSDLNGYVDRVAKLFRLDAALLSLETKQNLQAVAISIGLTASAVAVVFLGLVILLFAAVLLLIQLGVAPSLAALIVAATLFAGSAALAFAGTERLKNSSLTPRRTLAQFTSNIQALRSIVRHETNS